MAMPAYYPHQLLISMPKLSDDIFTESVIYVYQHNEKGACGIIINKLISSDLGTVVKQLDMKSTAEIASHPVHFGGPVNPENGFIIYPKENITNNNVTSKGKILDPLIVTAHQQTLEEIVQGNGPKQFLVALGYCTWEAGQLENELHNNYWLLAPYCEKLLFTAEVHKRRALAAKLAGFNIHQLSSTEGHA